MGMSGELLLSVIDSVVKNGTRAAIAATKLIEVYGGNLIKNALRVSDLLGGENFKALSTRLRNIDVIQKNEVPRSNPVPRDPTSTSSEPRKAYHFDGPAMLVHPPSEAVPLIVSGAPPPAPKRVIP